MSNEPELPDSVKPEELVVDLDHVDIVVGALRRLFPRPDNKASPMAGGPEVAVKKTDDRLGLALLTVPVPPVELDDLLQELRRQFGARYGGWVPVIGKNRTIDGVIGAGTSKPMSASELLGTSKPMTWVDPSGLTGVVSLSSFIQPGGEGTTGSGVKVGVLDTPFIAHPQLVAGHTIHAESPSVPPSVPSVPPGGPVQPKAGHGTFVVSRILARAPGAELFVCGALNGDTGQADNWDVAVAMLHLADRVDILNVSLGCHTADGEPPLIFSRAVERLNPDVLVVAAAGNHAYQDGWGHGRTSRSPTWPAALPGVVAVGAVDDAGQPAVFSPLLPWVRCTAPGVDVPGAYLYGLVTVHDENGNLVDKEFDGHATWSGTSFAAATVSGAVAAAMTGGTDPRRALDRVLADPASLVRAHAEPS